MRAALRTRYGGPEEVRLREVPTPEPTDGEIRVHVHATTVSRTDCGNLRGHPRFARVATGLLRPKEPILGLDFAGVVDAVGADVTRFEEGDRVFGIAPGGYGAHAEYLCLSATGAVTSIPDGLAFAETVLCEGVWYASTYLDAFGLGPNHHVLVYGASGAIGTAAVQLAKARGARVTAVVEGRHLDLARSLGADTTIDYTAEDYTQAADRCQFILDAVGKADYFACRRLLEPGGAFSATDFGPRHQNIPLSIWSSLTRRRRVTFPLPKEPERAVETAASLLASGALRAVVDRAYPFEEIATAYRYVETARKTGIVVLNVSGAG